MFEDYNMSISFEDYKTLFTVTRLNRNNQLRLQSRVKPIGELLFDFIDCDFNSKEDFLQFFKYLGIGALCDLSISRTVHESIDSHDTNITDEDYNALLISAWNESHVRISEIQLSFKKLVSLCLDIDYDQPLNKLSAKSRFFIVLSKYQYIYYSIQDRLSTSKEVLAPKIFSGEIPEINLSCNIEELEKQSNQVENMVAKLHITNSIINFLNYEFMELVIGNHLARKCKNCGRYFVIGNRPDRIYCDRVYPEQPRPCSKIGAEAKYTKSLVNDPIEAAYRKASKRFNIACNSGKSEEGKQKYNDWVAYAKEKRSLAKAGIISFDEYISWLDSTTRKKYTKEADKSAQKERQQ